MRKEQVAFSVTQEHVGVSAQVFSYHRATTSQTFDCKIKPRASEHDFFLEAEIYLFISFVLKIQTFRCVTFGYLVEEDHWGIITDRVNYSVKLLLDFTTLMYSLIFFKILKIPNIWWLGLAVMRKFINSLKKDFFIFVYKLQKYLVNKMFYSKGR